MNSSQLRENIEDNLEDLKRCYEICVHGYDRVSLKNLAHALRKWVDMSSHVQLYMNVNMPSVYFEKYTLTRKAGFVLRDCNFIVVGFPRAVTTIINSSEGSRIPLMTKKGARSEKGTN